MVWYGAPRGSIVSPLQSLIYINDVKNVDFEGRFILCADDTNFTCEDSNNDDLFPRAQLFVMAVHNVRVLFSKQYQPRIDHQRRRLR